MVLAAVVGMVRVRLTCLENHSHSLGRSHGRMPCVISDPERGRKLDALGEIRAQLFLFSFSSSFFFTAPNYAGLNLVRSKRRGVALV